MNPLDRLKEAEASGMPVTLDPSEISFINGQMDQYHALYIQNANHLHRIRKSAMEAAEALRGYNPQSGVADDLVRAVRGEEL